jgi:hypothetical protein
MERARSGHRFLWTNIFVERKVKKEKRRVAKFATLPHKRSNRQTQKETKMKSIDSKIFVSLGLIALLAGLNGCLTYKTIGRAQGTATGSFFLPTKSVDADGETVHLDKPRPGYYAFLPLTIPVDIATSPIQGIFILCYVAGGGKIVNQSAAVNNSNPGTK